MTNNIARIAITSPRIANDILRNAFEINSKYNLTNENPLVTVKSVTSGTLGK
jgi:hypothetical protein